MDEKIIPFQQKVPDRTRVLALSVLGVSEVEISDHAVTQMEIRGISESDIIHTLTKPTITEGLPTEAGRRRFRWNKTVRTAIDVVFELKPKRVHVITAIKITRRLVERKKR